MKLSNIQTGWRVSASFGIVLLIMFGMTVISLWRQQAAETTMRHLVGDKLAKQLLISEQLGAVRLNGLRAFSIAQSDSLEVAEIFQAQMDEGDRVLLAMEASLAAMPHDGVEQGKLVAVGSAKAAFLKARAEVLRLKNMGRTQDVAALLGTQVGPSFKAYTAALEASLAHQAEQARASAAISVAQFRTSRVLLIALGLGAVLAGAALSWSLTRSIAPPLNRALGLALDVAGGNLRRHIRHDRQDEIGRLFDALSEMTSRLSRTVSQVQQGASSIDLASSEIAAGNLDLSRRTEHQAASLEETASSMEALMAAVRENSSNARKADALAQSAAQVAGDGVRVVASMMETMKHIDAYGKKIADITGLIDAMAFQTNILALNAAVEAARAGEQGRGFAVVASEVRTLAQRSATAAGEIRTLIGESTQRIISGNEQVRLAGKTMDGIAASVHQVTAVMGAISAASTDQEHSIGQINAAIKEMDDVTQQNAALVEQAAAAADSLRLQANALTGLSAYFRV